ncbi:MAG: ArnT family glycosyltransferase [Oceanococcus sp.]
MKAFLQWLHANDERKGWRIALLAFVVLSAGFGLRDPWPPNEPSLALMARDMADSGEWLIPYLAGEPFSGHPPFAIWLQAAFYDTIGSMRLSFLLPALLASLGTLWLVYDLAKKLWGPRTGRLAATALLCSFQFMVQAHRGHVDAVLMFWSTLALYSLLQYMLIENTRRWLTVAGVAMGFGILTKGVGYLPALMIIPYTWMYRQGWQGLPRDREMSSFWLVGAGTFTVVLAWALPALGFVSGADDAALDNFRRDLLINLTGGTELLDVSDHRAWWYLPVQALVLWLPLSLMLPWKLRIWRDRLKAQDALIGLLLAYILLSLLIFSVLPGKHGVQLLVLLPAMALLMAPYLGGLWWRPGVQRLSVISLWVMSGLAISIGVLGHEPQLWPAQIDRPDDVPNLMWNFLLTLGALGLIISVALRGRPRALGLPAFFFLGWLLLGYWAYPTLNDLRTPKTVFAQAQAHLQADAQLTSWNWSPQLELFSGDVQLQRSTTPQQALKWIAAGEQRWLLVDQTQLQSALGSKASQWEQHELGRRHRIDWVLARPNRR